MNQSTQEALDVLRRGTAAEPSPEAEARIRAGIERAVGLTLPVAIAAPLVTTAMAKLFAGTAKAFWTTTLAKTVVVFVASVGVGSLATVVVAKVVSSRAVPSTSASARVALRPPPPRVEVGPTEPKPPRNVDAEATPEVARAVRPIEVPRLEQPQPAPSGAQNAVHRIEPAAPAPLEPSSGETPLARPAHREALPGGPPLGPGTHEPEATTDEPGADSRPVRCGDEGARENLERAREAFSDGRPQVTVTLLDRYHATCPTGEWPEESWQLRIKALCTLGRTTDAKGFMGWYWLEHPAAAHLAQPSLRAVCPADVVSQPAKEP